MSEPTFTESQQNASHPEKAFLPVANDNLSGHIAPRFGSSVEDLEATIAFIQQKPWTTAAIFAAVTFGLIGAIDRAERMYPHRSAAAMRAFDAVIKNAAATDGIQCVNRDGTEDHFSPAQANHAWIRNEYKYYGGQYTGCHGADDPAPAVSLRARIKITPAPAS